MSEDAPTTENAALCFAAMFLDTIERTAKAAAKAKGANTEEAAAASDKAAKAALAKGEDWLRRIAAGDKNLLWRVRRMMVRVTDHLSVRKLDS